MIIGDIADVVVLDLARGVRECIPDCWALAILALDLVRRRGPNRNRQILDDEGEGRNQKLSGRKEEALGHGCTRIHTEGPTVSKDLDCSD